MIYLDDFFCFGSFSLYNYRKYNPKGIEHMTFMSKIITTKNQKLTQEIKVGTQKPWLGCRCVEFSLCWNRFPDDVKSDMMGTSSGNKETARGVNGNHKKAVCKHGKRTSSGWLLGSSSPVPPEFFPPLLENYEVTELLKKGL